jgi:hypothetical protein
MVNVFKLSKLAGKKDILSPVAMVLFAAGEWGNRLRQTGPPEP